jgi:CHAT domain-containing protein
LARQLAESNRQLLQASGDRLATLQLAVKESRTELQMFRNRLDVQHPQLRYVRATTGPITQAQIHQLLPTPESALLEFIVGDQHSTLFVYTSGRLHSYPIAISRNTLNTRIREFRAKITSHSAVYQPLAKSLYSTLLLPAERQLQGKTALCIIPDGDLWELPFQALLTPAGTFLVEDYAVSYAPSLAVLRDMRQRRRVAQAPSSLLALGNPTMGAKPLLVGARGLRDSFEPLPEAETEVREVARLFGNARSTVLLGSRATEATFKSTAASARVLHFATHGVLNNASPLYSYLVLAQDNGPSREDGLLEAWEVMQLDLRADLAVLSACETGRGRIRAGEGVIGLSWALFVAGVPTTVVSQWKVESSSTAQLMRTFYERWMGGQSPARALQSAARKLLQNDRYAHPFFWAPFVAIGNAQ